MKYINSDTFEGCSSLTSIEIPSSVEQINAGAFEGCSSLTSVEIPSSVTMIWNSAFEGCSSLTSIEIPSGVATISDSAFEGCSSLTSIEIPSSVKFIGSDAFKGCSDLTIYCLKGSYAEQYARENNLKIQYINGTPETPDQKPTETPGKDPSENPGSQVSGISIPKKLSLNSSEQKQLSASITPANASDKSITWKSDNPRVASVSSSGLVKAESKGTAVITATASNGIQASCTVTVLVPAVSVRLSQPSLSMTAGSQRSITAEILPLGSTDSVNWKSSNTAVAEVYDGRILAKKEGTAKITAYTESGAKASCTVTVKKSGNGASSEIKKVTSKKAKIKSAKNVKKKSITLKLGGSVNGSGYKIQYGASRKFKGAKTVTAKGSTATVKKLKAKKTYYIRVRIYKKISGKTYYGKWSSVKSVKIKK